MPCSRVLLGSDLVSHPSFCHLAWVRLAGGGKLIKSFTGTTLMNPATSSMPVHSGFSYVSQVALVSVPLGRIAPNATALVICDEMECVGCRYPLGVAVSGEGDIAVSDWKSNRVQWLSQDGLPKLPVGGSGSELGRLDGPAGVAFHKERSLLICDYGNQRVQVHD